MYKEIIIIVTVITLIVTLDILTNNYTQNTVKMMSEELTTLREDVLQKDQKSAQDKMVAILSKWQEKNNVLAYYIEHNELEKIKTQLTGLAANINVQEYEPSMVQLDTAIFLLENLQEKQKLDFKSMF